MRRSSVVIGLFGALLGMVGAWVALLSGQSQSPVFRANADTVAVNVSVKRRNLPVQGLSPGDFRLYDNDVAQRVVAVSHDAMPVDLTFVLDLSGSAFPSIDTPRKAVERVAAGLRPTDRFRVLTMGNAVVNAVSWQPAGVPDTSKILFALGHISLVADSVLVALSYRASPDRRHLVVALTDGEDICSLAPGDSLQRAAERSGGVFHWINVELGGPVAATRDALGQGVSAKIPMTDYWKRSAGVESACRNPAGAPVRDIGRFLSDATRLTGGSVHTARSVADHDAIVGFFDAILDDFRRSYIVHYVPEGVPRTGWHRLRVELQEKGLTVRARPGYWGADAVPDAR